MERIDRRSLLAVPASLALLGPIGMARAAARPRPLPLLPINTIFSHWDHHWFQWLNGHPLYESIEVALGGPLPTGEPLVQLCLTKRGGRQGEIHYLNDESAARFSALSRESYFVPIRVMRSGAAGAPQGLTLDLLADDGMAIHWEVNFAPGRTLSKDRAVVKSPNGYVPYSVLQFWSADRSALTADATVTIGGKAYRPKSTATGRRNLTAYSSGAFSLVLPFAGSELAPTVDGFTSSWGTRTFVRHGDDYVTSFDAFHQPASITLRCNSDGELTGYEHRHGAHILALTLDSPLWPLALPLGFAFTVDGRRIARGTVRPMLTHVYSMSWRFSDPDWAKAAGLRTVLVGTAGLAYRVEMTRLR